MIKILQCLTFCAILLCATYMMPPRAQAQVVPELTNQQVLDQIRINAPLVYTALRIQFLSMGITDLVGIGKIIEGITAALATTLTNPSIQRTGLNRFVRWSLTQSPRMLNGIVALLNSASVNAGNVAGTIMRGITRARGASISLGPYARLLGTFLLVEATQRISFAEGQEYTRITLLEYDSLALSSERSAYVDLLQSLMQRLTAPNSNIQLCKRMRLGEAATRLRINMQTSPNKPFWNIICGRPDPKLLSSWSNAGCHNSYMIYVVTSKGHVQGGGRKGSFVMGYRPYYNKYHCEAGNTYGDVAQQEIGLLRACNRFIGGSNNPNKCKIAGRWRYE